MTPMEQKLSSKLYYSMSGTDHTNQYGLAPEITFTHKLIQKLGYRLNKPDNILTDLRTKIKIIPAALGSPSALKKQDDITAPVYGYIVRQYIKQKILNKSMSKPKYQY